MAAIGQILAHALEMAGLVLFETLDALPPPPRTASSPTAAAVSPPASAPARRGAACIRPPAARRPPIDVEISAQRFAISVLGLGRGSASCDRSWVYGSELGFTSFNPNSTSVTRTASPPAAIHILLVTSSPPAAHG